MPSTLQGQPIDQRTPELALPLPHLDNWQEDDVPRMITALTLIDQAVQLQRQGAAVYEAAMAARVDLVEWAAARPSNTTYGYDAQGRLGTVTASVAGVARVTTYGYDAQGRLATASYPVAGGAAVRTDTYHYDAAGRVSGVTSEDVPT